MAVISARPHLRPGPDCAVLRFAMRADATLCGGLGLLAAMAADPLSELTGLSATAEWFVGAGFVGYGALLYLLAAVGDIRRIGIGVIVANLVCAVAVLAVLAAGVPPLTGFGMALTLATTVATFGFAYLQYLGVRRLA